MTQSWLEFLGSRGAQIADGQVSGFSSGTPAHGDDTLLCDLSNWGLIRFSGPEAQSFLQGQLSNDVTAIGPDAAQYSSYCSPQGRMLASFLLWQEDDAYLMLLPAALRERIQKRLSMFILRAKVKAEDVSAGRVHFGLAGRQAAEVAASVLGNVPARDLAVARTGVHTVIRVPGGRFLLSVQPDAATELWTKLAATAVETGNEDWNLHDIRNGILFVLPETQEQFVPQMANYELIGGVSFKKGCYPGQEIVARTQYLGRLKRRTYLAHVSAEPAPAPGDALYSDDLPGQATGMVANVARNPEGGHDLLAVMQISTVESGTPVQLRTGEGPQLEFRPLPYKV